MFIDYDPPKKKSPNIAIVQIMPIGECFIQLTDDDGRVCSEKEYEEFLFSIGADLVYRY